MDIFCHAIISYITKCNSCTGQASVVSASDCFLRSVCFSHRSFCWSTEHFCHFCVFHNVRWSFFCNFVSVSEPGCFAETWIMGFENSNLGFQCQEATMWKTSHQCFEHSRFMRFKMHSALNFFRPVKLRFRLCQSWVYGGLIIQFSGSGKCRLQTLLSGWNLQRNKLWRNFKRPQYEHVRFWDADIKALKPFTQIITQDEIYTKSDTTML